MATGLAVAADECPAIANPVALNDEGIIEGPTGAYRVCSLPAQFTVSTTLPRVPGVLYALNGRVDVGLIVVLRRRVTPRWC